MNESRNKISTAMPAGIKSEDGPEHEVRSGGGYKSRCRMKRLFNHEWTRIYNKGRIERNEKILGVQ